MNHSIKAAQRGKKGHITLSDHTAQVWAALRRSRSPGVMHHLSQCAVKGKNLHEPHIPDAVIDDGMGGKRRVRAADGLWDRLRAIEQDAAVFGHDLILITVNADDHNPAHLYDGTGTKWARGMARKLADGLPHFWRLEYGPDRGIHVHVVVSAEAGARAAAQGAHVRIVWSLWGTAKYLSKPQDSRAAILNYRRMPEVAAHIDAVRTYLAARYERIKATGNPRANLADGQGFGGWSQCVCEIEVRPPRSTSSSTLNLTALYREVNRLMQAERDLTLSTAA